MIRAIAAIDSKQGLANEQGIPWKLPTDAAHFRSMTANSTVIMGYRTYTEFPKPLPNRLNLVASRKDTTLRDGFELVPDARQFLQNFRGDIWVMGGAKLYSETIDLVAELHLTHIEKDFHCTKFFPNFKDRFGLVSRSTPHTENGVKFSFCVYQRKRST